MAKPLHAPPAAQGWAFKNLPKISKRARYYQAVMDVDNLQPGEDYSNLKDFYVIFLCLGDPIGTGLPVYTFHHRADEDFDFLMKDGTTTVFFNAKQYDKMDASERRSFFEYLCKQKKQFLLLPTNYHLS